MRTEFGSARRRIAVVDAQQLFRTGVSLVLRGQEFEMVAEGNSGSDAIRIARELSLDLMLIDLKIPGGGTRVLSQLSQSCPSIHLVVLTESEDQDVVAAALRCGAQGYVLKHANTIELLSALRAVSEGSVYLTPALGARLVARGAPFAAPESGGGAADGLSRRERQILTQVATGATNKEIGKVLKLSDRTIKHHMTIIMQKLGVRNRVEAVITMRNREIA